MKKITIQYSDDMTQVTVEYEMGDESARGVGATVREAVRDAFTSPPVRDEETDAIDEVATSEWREWERRNHNMCLNLIAYSAL